MTRARVAVIGGGPAGLAAAEVLANAGIDVTVYDQQRAPARKFMLAGRGGLNLTHTEPIDAFLGRYGDRQAHLENAIRDFTPADLRSWCHELGEPTFIGTSGRVFPETFKASPLLRRWLSRLAGLGVEFAPGQSWRGWSPAPRTRDPGVIRITPSTGEDLFVEADAFVFALGGASWPRSGSTGGWVEPFTDAGVGVAPLRATNCGVQVRWTDIFRNRFAGSPIKNVAVNDVRGDIVVTGYGLEGGPIYANNSHTQAQLDLTPTAKLRVNLLPDLKPVAIIDRLSKRRKGSSATRWLQGVGLSAAAIGLLREATDNQLPHHAAEIAALCHQCEISVAAMAPIDRAISSSGGIKFAELNSDYMVQSLPGNFVAGEMLDWHAPTGGYLLQACFSTGRAAAFGALRWLGIDGAMR